MADASKTSIMDIAIPALAFLASAYSPQGAHAAQALTGALSLGQRRRAGAREDQRLSELMGLKRQEAEQRGKEFEAGRGKRELEGMQVDFERENLQGIQQLLGAPVPGAEKSLAQSPRESRLLDVMGRGDPIREPSAPPTQQVRQERMQQLGSTPGGAAQLTAAGLGDVAKNTQALMPKAEDPRQFAADKREAMGMFANMPEGRMDPALAKQLKAGIAGAKTQQELTDRLADVPMGLGAKPEDVDTQVYKELTNQGMSGIEAMKNMAQARREPKVIDPLDQEEKRARITKLQADTAKLRRDAKGDLSQGDRTKLMSDTRKQITGEDVYKDYQSVNTGYTRVAIGAKMGKGVGDLAIVNGVVRMLDPNSVVRPSEFQTAANAQGWLEWAKTWIPKIESGALLDEEVRARFLSLAQQLHDSHRNLMTEEIGRSYGNILKNTGVSLEEIFPVSSSGSATQPSGSVATLGPPPGAPGEPSQAQGAPAFTIKGIREKGQ